MHASYRADNVLYRFEAPTWALAGIIYGGWLALTGWFHALPWWLVLALGSWLIAWHGSLQHEAIHGHPTRRPWLNGLVAGIPLWLWLPYGVYRESHLAHHREPTLTDPLQDPESYYLTPDQWARMGPLRRAARWVHQTLLGRLLLGPLWAVAALLRDELRRVARGDLRHLRHWGAHAVGVALVVGWVVGVCEIPLWQYLLLLVYPGLGLTLLRSFAEHRPDPQPAHRTVVTEAGPLLSLLFLHNNLHVVHHRYPRLPWYRLPQRYRQQRQALLARNGGHRFAGGYLEQLQRFALRPKDAPVLPAAHSAAPPRVESAGATGPMTEGAR